jgi:hypothetical protein
MKLKLKIAFLLCAIVCLTACDADAIRFATKTRTILAERSKTLEARITTEQAAYQALAATLVNSSAALQQTRLSNELIERSAALTASYYVDHKSVAGWRAELQPYRQMTFDSQIVTATAEVDQVAKQLSTLQNLQIEKAQIDALDKLLATLVTKPTIGASLGFLEGFAKDTATAYQAKVCAALATDLTNAASQPDQQTLIKNTQKDYGCK